MSWIKFWCCKGGDWELDPESERHWRTEEAQTEKKERGKRRRRERKWRLWRKPSHDDEERETPLENMTELMEETETEPVDISTETEQLLGANTEMAIELLESVEDSAGPPSSTPLAGEQQSTTGTSELLEILPRDVAGGAVVDQHLENQTLTCEQTEEENKTETLLEETPTSSTSLESESGAPELEKVEDTGEEPQVPKTLESSNMTYTIQSFDDQKMMTVVRVISAAESFRYLQNICKASDLQNLEFPPVNNTDAVIEAACQVVYILLQRLAASPDQHLINKVLRVMARIPVYIDVGLLLTKHLNSIREHNGTALESGPELQPEVGVDAEAETLHKILCPPLDKTYTHLVDEMLTGLLVQLAADALIYIRNAHRAPPELVSNKSKTALVAESLEILLEELVTGRDQHLIKDILRLMSSVPDYQDIMELLVLMLKDYSDRLAGDQTESTKNHLEWKLMAGNIEPPQLPQPPQQARGHRDRINGYCPGVKPPPPRPESQHGPRHQSRAVWTQRHQGPKTCPRVPRHLLKEEATDQRRQRTYRPRYLAETPKPCHRPNDECAPPRGERNGFGGRGRREGGRGRKRADWWQHDNRCL